MMHITAIVFTLQLIMKLLVPPGRVYGVGLSLGGVDISMALLGTPHYLSLVQKISFLPAFVFTIFVALKGSVICRLHKNIRAVLFGIYVMLPTALLHGTEGILFGYVYDTVGFSMKSATSVAARCGNGPCSFQVYSIGDIYSLGCMVVIAYLAIFKNKDFSSYIDKYWEKKYRIG
jgi:hypothetical protein